MDSNSVTIQWDRERFFVAGNDLLRCYVEDLQQAAGVFSGVVHIETKSGNKTSFSLGLVENHKEWDNTYTGATLAVNSIMAIAFVDTGGGGSGTVTSFSFTNDATFSGVVANPTTAPALSLTLLEVDGGVY